MLRQRQQTLRTELQAIADQANDRAAFLRLAETLTAFLTRLRGAAETLSVIERQKIVRLLVKEILVGEDAITIRHSIPIPAAPPQNGGSEALRGPNYLLCKGSDQSAVSKSVSALCVRCVDGAAVSASAV
jgi:site-specific DNA recombinase